MSWSLSLLPPYLMTSVEEWLMIDTVVTSPAGAVAKYCDEYWVCLSVGLFVCPRDISGTKRAIFIRFFVHVACVRTVPWLGPLPNWKCIIGRERGWECTRRAKYAIYHCRVFDLLHSFSLKKVSTYLVIQELIRGWDSERELFYDDVIHAEASAYAHWTDFLITTITKHRIFINICQCIFSSN